MIFVWPSDSLIDSASQWRWRHHHYESDTDAIIKAESIAAGVGKAPTIQMQHLRIIRIGRLNLRDKRIECQ